MKEMPKRRKLDNCVFKKFYDFCTPYLQVGGYLIMLGTLVAALFMGFSFLQKTNEANAAVLDIQLWRATVTPDLSALKQEVHDIHEWYADDHNKKR